MWLTHTCERDCWISSVSGKVPHQLDMEEMWDIKEEGLIPKRLKILDRYVSSRFLGSPKFWLIKLFGHRSPDSPTLQSPFTIQIFSVNKLEEF